MSVSPRLVRIETALRPLFPRCHNITAYATALYEAERARAVDYSSAMKTAAFSVSKYYLDRLVDADLFDHEYVPGEWHVTCLWSARISSVVYGAVNKRNLLNSELTHLYAHANADLRVRHLTATHLGLARSASVVDITNAFDSLSIPGAVVIYNTIREDIVATGLVSPSFRHCELGLRTKSDKFWLKSKGRRLLASIP